MAARSTYTKPRRRARNARTAMTPEIFFDSTGRRWRFVKGGFLFVGVLVALMSVISWKPLHQPPSGHNANLSAPLSIPNVDSHAPMIGVGPLVRLVRVERGSGEIFAVDPLTNQTYGAITGDDADIVGPAPYATQRYGYSSVAHKSLELTFDDGPDPIWTPKILDLLSKYKVPATFFVIGTEVVKYPAIVQREVKEGYAVGNHSLTHPDLQPNQVEQQFVTNDRIIRAVTGVATTLIRLPFDGYYSKNVPASNQNTVMLDAERLGYIVSTEEFDTNDWMYGDPALRPKTPIPLPPTTADNLTILLHDGGGNRAATLAYLERLIPWALAQGYHFYSLPQISPQVVTGTHHITPSVWDSETFWMYQALWAWPNQLIGFLFAFAILSVVISGGLNVLLAVGRRVRRRRRLVSQHVWTTGPPVSVVIAAYNEEKVIAHTLEAILRSHYRCIKEIIVVDDGSSDRTSEIVTAMAAQDARIRLLRQENAGKSAALNRAFARARSPIVVTLDADTLFMPDTVGALAHRFAGDKRKTLGAVAGVVKVGNVGNVLTRWQALEYLTQIGVERGAQDILGGIMVVPGACAAWRKHAVIRVGGYSRATLAEDCDLTLELQRAGYRVTQADEAVSYTEAPETVRPLMRQRFRWMYGNMQAMWKHRDMIFNARYGWLGMLTLPLAMISVLLPVVFLPFIYAMAVVTYVGQGWQDVALYLAIFMLAQCFIAVIGVWLTEERPSHLLIAPFYRLIYEPLRAYILYKSALMVLRGARSSWNKLQRTGAVELAPAKPAAESVA